jgi:hypothetical protein
MFEMDIEIEDPPSPSVLSNPPSSSFLSNPATSEFNCPLCYKTNPRTIAYVHLKKCIYDYEKFFHISCEIVPPVPIKQLTVTYSKTKIKTSKCCLVERKDCINPKMSKKSAKIVLAKNDIEAIKENPQVIEYVFCHLLHLRSKNAPSYDFIKGSLFVNSMIELKCLECSEKLNSYIKLCDVNDKIELVNNLIFL